MTTGTSEDRCEADLSLPATTAYKILSELESILAEEEAKFRVCLALPFLQLKEGQVEEIRVRFSGRKSPLAELLKSLRYLPNEERKSAGARINALKELIERELSAFLSAWNNEIENARLASECDDITLPAAPLGIGSRHPTSVVMNECIQALHRLGFTVVDGPELESDFYNFEALNVLADHPAREMQDTFFLASGWVLRTHTSNIQAHALLERTLPLKIICPGYVYRNECDVSHLPSFRQLECLVVDKGVNLGHLRFTMNAFFREVFGREVKMRLRSSYFPFTEPSAEMDVECQQCFGKGCRTCKNTGWVEIGGCGIVNRKVLVACGIDPEVYSGFAFGFGVDRMALLKHSVADLRSMYEGNVALAEQLTL